jgi:hypothetical protein
MPQQSGVSLIQLSAMLLNGRPVLHSTCTPECRWRHAAEQAASSPRRPNTCELLRKRGQCACWHSQRKARRQTSQSAGSCRGAPSTGSRPWRQKRSRPRAWRCWRCPRSGRRLGQKPTATHGAPRLCSGNGCRTSPSTTAAQSLSVPFRHPAEARDNNSVLQWSSATTPGLAPHNKRHESQVLCIPRRQHQPSVHWEQPRTHCCKGILFMPAK